MPKRDRDERPVAEHTQTGKVAVDSGVSQHRRKIIKASAAAVPAIMTLKSGAAAAVASSYYCTGNNHKQALNEIGENDYVLEGNQADNHDQWLRVMGKKVTKIERPAGTEKVIYCTRTGGGVGVPGNPALDWQCFNEDGTEYTGITQGDINNADDVSLLVYLHFDEYGDDTNEPALYYPIIRTVAEAPPGYSPLTGSCLASIHPNLIIFGNNNLG